MTRINLLKPSHLTKVHLIAEYKELTQFLHLVNKRVVSKHPMDDLPLSYCLNGGHIKFFYDKGRYLYNRYILIYDEMVHRNISVDVDKFNYNLNRIKESYSNSLFNDYTPDNAAYKVAIDRIGSRIEMKPKLYPDKDIFFNNIDCYGVKYEFTPDLT